MHDMMKVAADTTKCVKTVTAVYIAQSIERGCVHASRKRVVRYHCVARAAVNEKSMYM